MKSNIVTKIVLLLTGVCTILSAAAVAPALPAISSHFDNSSLVPWIMLASNYAMMCCAPVFGKVVKRFGPLLTLRGGLVLYVVLGCGAYLLNDVTMIVASRVLYAVGVVAVMVCLNVLVASYFEGAERKTFIGLQGFAASLISLGIIQASGYLSGLAWNLPFLLYAYGIVVLLLSFLLPAPKPMQMPPSAAGDNAEKPKAFTPKIVRTMLTLVAAMMAYYVVMLFGPFLMTEVGGTPANVGTAIVLLTLTGALSALSYGKLKFSPNMVYSIGFGLTAAGYAVLGFAAAPLMVFAGIVVAGFGIGLLLPNSTAKLMGSAHPATIPTVMSFLVVCMFGGNAIGGTVAQVIRDLTSTGMTFTITALACAVVSVAYFGARNR